MLLFFAKIVVALASESISKIVTVTLPIKELMSSTLSTVVLYVRGFTARPCPMIANSTPEIK